MPRGKSRKQKAKRYTMRKPRTSLQITKNNLNLNEDLNLRWNLLNFKKEQSMRKLNDNALRKLNDIPKNTFLFSINGVMTKPGTKSLIRALDFKDYVYLEDTFLFNDAVTQIKILYKGFQVDEDYFCYCVYSRVLSPEQQEYKEDVNSRIQGFWNVYFLPAVNFFKNIDEYHLPIEPTRYFLSKIGALVYLLQIPYLQEKIEREREAILTLPESIRRYQRKAVIPLGEQFTRVKGRNVPENVENIIRSYI